MVLHGQSNLGQRFIGAALLHHLEGYHVQSLDLATLLGQSSGVSMRDVNTLRGPKLKPFVCTGADCGDNAGTDVYRS